MIDAASRYAQTATALYQDENGRTIVYLRRRFLPQGLSQPVLAQVVVADGDRLDLIAARTLGAAEQAWRVCDANNAMNPFDLTDTPGQTLRIAPPQFQDPNA